MKSLPIPSNLTVFALLTASVSAPAQGQSTLQRLGDIEGGAIWSDAFAVSANGAIVVGDSDVGGALFQRFFAATTWSEGDGLLPVFMSPEMQVSAWSLGVSADGNIIVGAIDYGLFSPNGRPAFVYDVAANSLVEIGDLPGGASGVPAATARGVSSDGRIVVGVGQSDLGTEAFRFDRISGEFTPLGDLPEGAFASYAQAISTDGSTIVGIGSGPGNERQAARWVHGGTIEGLGFLETTVGVLRDSRAEAVTADGRVIVGASRSVAAPNGGEAFLWTAEDGMLALGDLAGGGFQSIAYAVSADGAMVVGRATIEGPSGPFGGGSAPRAFIWTAQTGLRDLHEFLAERGLNVGDWKLEEARGISADGRVIVGNGRNPAGDAEAWIVRLASNCREDIDNDGDVDIQDLAFLLGNFSASGAGDVDENGVVDLQDLALLLAVFGSSC